MTVFSFGGGQESTYLLLRLINEPEFFNRVIDGDLLVVGSDTGNEHEHTYKAIELVKEICKKNNIEFYWVTPDMGFHPNTWQSLTSQYERNSGIGSASFRQSCTDKLKIQVVNNFVEQWLKNKYGYTGKNKKAYHSYLNEFKKPIRLILGFAAGEESRIKNGNKFDPSWKRKTMQRSYPLIDEGIARQDCITYNESAISLKVYPSNCMFCFYQSDQEILWLYRNYPEQFNKWVSLERSKLDKYANAEKNYGVYGKITLIEKLKKAELLYGHWDNDMLDEYKFSHGHCIKSKY